MSCKSTKRTLGLLLCLPCLAVLMLLFAHYGQTWTGQIRETADPYGKNGTAGSLNGMEVKFACGDTVQVVRLWRAGTPEDGEAAQEEPGDGYIFLPSAADLSSLCFYYDPNMGTLYANGEELASGKPLSHFSLNETFELTFTSEEASESLPVTILQSQNLPVLFLTNDMGELSWLRKEKYHKDTGSLTLVDADGAVEYSGLLDSFSGRGNATWNFQKKPWGFKLAEPASLLGMAAAEKWVLFANAMDDSKGLRNKAVYSLAQAAGIPYTAHLEWADVYLNGTYAGLYQLAEKIETSPQRVNIGDLTLQNKAANLTQNIDPEAMEQLNEADEGGPVRRYSVMDTPHDHSGGYILEHNYGYKLYNKDYYLETETGEGFVVRAPDQVSKTEADYIGTIVQQVENAILAEDGFDPESGKYYTDLIDLESWAAKYLVEEISKNEAAGSTSSYFYKKQGDPLLYAGPPWDYDKCLGRWYSLATPLGITGLTTHGSSSAWWPAFVQKPEAKAEIIQQYADNFRSYLVNELPELLDEWSKTISASKKMDHIRWFTEIHNCDYPYEVPTDPDAYASQSSLHYIKDWLADRVDFLDDVWLNGHEWYTLHLADEGTEDTVYEFYYLRPGETVGSCLEEAAAHAVDYYREEYDEERIFLGWQDSDTETPFLSSTPIEKNTVLSALWANE